MDTVFESRYLIDCNFHSEIEINAINDQKL